MVRAPSGKASRIMKIERILKSELMDFAAELQAFPGAYLPLSTVRAEALAHHPFSEADTPMLYLLREGEELVGFQSVLPDCDENGAPFVWTSGGWVRIDRRRHGFGSLLLQAVQADYRDQVAVANMAPVRQKMLTARKDYLAMPELGLVRYYRRFATAHFLAHRLPAVPVSKRLLQGVDAVGNAIWDRWLGRSPAADGPQPDIGSSCSAEDAGFLGEHLPWTETDTQYLNWTLAYPWIGTSDRDQNEQEKYPFSCYARSFGRHWCRFRDAAGQLQAILLLQWRDGQVKIPLWVGTEECIERSSAYLNVWLQGKQIDALSVPSEMADRIQKSGGKMLMSKDISFPFIVHKRFADGGLPPCIKNYSFYRGDWGVT